MTKTVKLLATAAMGLEAIVAKEVRALGYQDITVENGKVIFDAPISAIPRCNLWLRSADRVKVIVGEFEAKTFDQLFEDRKSTRLNSSHVAISYAVFCLKKKNK